MGIKVPRHRLLFIRTQGSLPKLLQHPSMPTFEETSSVRQNTDNGCHSLKQGQFDQAGRILKG